MDFSGGGGAGGVQTKNITTWGGGGGYGYLLDNHVQHVFISFFLDTLVYSCSSG